MRNLGNLLVIIGCAILLGLFLIVVLAISKVNRTDRWSNYLHGISNLSSPRPADLNRDGMLDIVVGTGSGEISGSDSAVVAMDGRTGNVLWAASSPFQMLSSPVFQDINTDGVPDVFIGGRSGNFMALGGASGEKIWDFGTMRDQINIRDSLGNFYTPQWIDDVNGDQYRDLLIANGGHIGIPDNVVDRPPGRVMVISAAEGRILAMDTMPDGHETYMSAISADLNGDGETTVIFGSGGEYIKGRLYQCPLNELLNNNLANAKILTEGENSGFIAPPVLADINEDKVLDIVANAVDGKMLAFDGSNGSVLWEVNVPGTIIYSSIAVGDFTGNGAPDFFTNMGKGLWPRIRKTIQVMVKGTTGEIVFMDSLGFFQINSPLAADFDGDGVDEVLYNVNRPGGNIQGNPLANLHKLVNRNIIFDFKNGRVRPFGKVNQGVNPTSTPWLGDLDNDHMPDLVYTHFADSTRFQPFNGMRVHRFESNEYPDVQVSWGSYMGSHYNGIYYSDSLHL